MKLICVDLIYRLLQSMYETFFLPVWSCDDFKRFSDLLLSDGSWGITSIHITDSHLHFLYIAALNMNKYFTVLLFYTDDWAYVIFILYHLCNDEIVYRVSSSLWLSDHKKLWHRIKDKKTTNMMLINQINHRIAEYSLLQLQPHFISNH